LPAAGDGTHLSIDVRELVANAAMALICRTMRCIASLDRIMFTASDTSYQKIPKFGKIFSTQWDQRKEHLRCIRAARLNASSQRKDQETSP
jgi:hypothetical protein